MMRYRVGFGSALFRDFERYSIQRIERAALVATDRAGKIVKREMRAQFASAGLGRLGFAIGATSDLEKRGQVKRRGPIGFSASTALYVRSRSERTLGAIEAYTEGADIRPARGRFLWIATDDIPARVGRYRMTPARYNQAGLVNTIGPLVAIPGRHSGEMLLIVRNVTVRVGGRRGSARRLPQRGGVRAGREGRDFIVAFVGIRRTSRAARVDPHAIVTQVQQQLPALIAAAMKGGKS